MWRDSSSLASTCRFLTPVRCSSEKVADRAFSLCFPLDDMVVDEEEGGEEELPLTTTELDAIATCCHISSWQE